VDRHRDITWDVTCDITYRVLCGVYVMKVKVHMMHPEVDRHTDMTSSPLYAYRLGASSCDIPYHMRMPIDLEQISHGISNGEVGGWGRVPFSRNVMSPTARRKWYLTTGRRAH